MIGSLAENHPHIDYLGLEVHRPGVGRLLLHAERTNVRNLRVICHDAVEVLKDCIPNDSFDEILVFFPDPWHKKRHHKRRLIDPAFVASVAAKLRSGFERGVRKVAEGIALLRAEVLDEADWKRFDSAGRLFWNMNTAADYEEARRILEAERE